MQLAGRALGAFARAATSYALDAGGELKQMLQGIATSASPTNVVPVVRSAGFAVGATGGYLSADPESSTYQKLEKAFTGGMLGLGATYLPSKIRNLSPDLAGKTASEGVKAFLDKDYRASFFKNYKKLFPGDLHHGIGLAVTAGAVYGGLDERLNILEGTAIGGASYAMFRGGFGKSVNVDYSSRRGMPKANLLNKKPYQMTEGDMSILATRGAKKKRFIENQQKGLNHDFDDLMELSESNPGFITNTANDIARRGVKAKIDSVGSANARLSLSAERRIGNDVRRFTGDNVQGVVRSNAPVRPPHRGRTMAIPEKYGFSGDVIYGSPGPKNWIKNNITVRRAVATGAIIGGFNAQSPEGDKSLGTWAMGALTGGATLGVGAGLVQGLTRAPMATMGVLGSSAVLATGAMEGYQNYEAGGRVGFNSMEADGDLALALHKIRHSY